MVTLVDHTDYGFTRKSLSYLKKDILAMLEHLSRKHRKPYGEVTVAFFSEERMRDLHRRHLKKNSPADVLTFTDSEAIRPAGDIALCPHRVLLYAFKDHRHPVSWFYHTLLHGLLHLYGLEHDYSAGSIEKIYRLQESILKKINLHNHLHEEVVYGIFEKIVISQSTSR